MAGLRFEKCELGGVRSASSSPPSTAGKNISARGEPDGGGDVSGDGPRIRPRAESALYNARAMLAPLCNAMPANFGRVVHTVRCELREIGAESSLLMEDLAMTATRISLSRIRKAREKVRLALDGLTVALQEADRPRSETQPSPVRYPRPKKMRRVRAM
jgi:hypothetical protein